MAVADRQGAKGVDCDALTSNPKHHIGQISPRAYFPVASQRKSHMLVTL
jgi:hypothetical protein